MIKSFFKSLAAKNRDLIVEEGEEIRGFMHLLMKRRNTGQEWTKEEAEDLKSHVKRLSLHVPVLIMIALPFGLALLPVLAEILDRRKRSRRQ
ncbi:MAG TPA: hypothetical protein VLZ07_13060 [Syntrophales bacterium]|nr:hypothetical protein [Syntrophales bacterium]